MRISEVVANFLKSQSQSPTELARQTGIPLADLVDALFGRRNFEIDEFLKICDALDVSVEEIWTDSVDDDAFKGKKNENKA